MSQYWHYESSREQEQIAKSVTIQMTFNVRVRFRIIIQFEYSEIFENKISEKNTHFYFEGERWFLD
jgi:hypothetical protein